MSDVSPTPPPALDLPDALSWLAKRCETVCVAECCGLRAFDFAPLHIASWLTRGGQSDPQELGRVSLTPLRVALDDFETAVAEQSPNEAGHVACVAQLNECFTRDSAAAWVAEVRASIDGALKLIDLAGRRNLLPAGPPQEGHPSRSPEPLGEA